MTNEASSTRLIGNAVDMDLRFERGCEVDILLVLVRD